MLYQQRQYCGYGKDYAGDAVGVGEGDVDFAEVGGLYEEVLVGEHGNVEGGAYPVDEAEVAVNACRDDEYSGADVQQCRHEQGIADAEGGGDGVELLGAVEGFVLQGVDDVEPGNPGEDREGEEHGKPREVAGDGEVGPDGS